MTNSSQTLQTPNVQPKDDRELLILADVCFEMFPIKELRNPHLILDELHSAFPDFEERDILKAISMALTWRRLLRAAGRPLH
jgi:hypothetical protein